MVERRYKALARELSTFPNNRGNSSLVTTRALVVNHEMYKPFLLNSRAQGVSGKNEQSTYTQWRGAPEARTVGTAASE